MYPQYMCILLYVIVIWCNRYFRDLLSIGVWGRGRCILSICAFCYICELIWCNTYFIDLLSIGVRGRGRCILSICAFCYM